MSLDEWLLRDVLTQSIQLWAERGELRYRAPSEALIPELRTRLREAREEMVAFLGHSILAPASAVQKRLWFLQRLRPADVSYNLSIVLRLRGALEEERYCAALRSVVARHEALRTSLRTFGGETCQMIASAHSTFAIPIIDLEPANVEAWLVADAAKPFGESDRLISATLLRSGSDEHLLSMRMHHAIMDRAALAVLLRDLADAYASQEQPAPVRQYRDFVAEQAATLTARFRQEAEAFWQSHLQGAPKQAALPYDRSRPEQESGDTQFVEIVFDKRTSANMRELCRARTVTPFVLGLTAVQAFIARITGDDDAVIGTAIDTRNGLEDEEMIGCCINTLPMRLALGAGDRFVDLLERNRVDSIAAIAAGSFPFDAIVQLTTAPADRTTSPLFAVMFDFPEADAPLLTPHNGIAAELLTPKPAGSKSDLVFSLSDDGDRLFGGLFYASDLFAARTANALASSFRAFLESALTAPTQPIAELPLLSAAEEQVELRRGTSERTPQHVPDALEGFAQSVERFGDRPAVVDPARRLTYRELDERSSRLAALLMKLDVGEGSCAGILLERGVSMVISMLAIWKCGAAYVPLDPADPEERARFVCGDLPLSVLITTKAMSVDPGVPMIDPDAVDLDGGEAAGATSGEGRTAYVIYTSGSTGTPKGVAVSHDGLRNLLAWHRRAYSTDERDRGSQIAGVAFDAAGWEIWPYLSCGAAVHFPADEDRQSAAAFVRWLSREEITMAFVPTPIIPSLLEVPEIDSLHLKALLTGGDQLHRRPDDRLPFPLINHYGPTENSVVATAGIVQSAPEPSLPSIGRPIDGVSVFILDERMRPVPAGVAGEIYIGGSSQASGYMNRPELTAQRFVISPFDARERLYRTGDRARFRPNDEIEFLGRLDHQVKIRGYRIELGEIEKTLERHDSVSEAIVVASELPSGEKRLVAFVVPENDRNVSAEELSASVRATLPQYMAPEIVFVDAFPLTVNGKIDRRMLTARGADMLPREREIEEPRTIKEEKLAEIWMELLGVSRIGRNDDFFELGGHSLLVMQCLSRIREMFDVDLPAAAFYSSSRLASIVEVIRKLQQSPLLIAAAEGGAGINGPIPLQPHGTKPPLFVVHAAGGHLLEYRALARELAAHGQPLFGLQAPGFDRETEPPTSLEDLACVYLAAVRRDHPRQPYRFGGYCIGGLIAFEMARQAQAAGLDVEPVLIFDTRIEGKILGRETWESEAAALFAGEVKTVIAPELLAGTDAEGMLHVVWDEFTRQWPADAERLTLSVFERLYRTYMTNLRVAREYVPERFEGELLVFEPEGRRGKPSGWLPLAASVQRHFTPGKHLTFMREPHARVLARTLDRVAEAASEARRVSSPAASA